MKRIFWAISPVLFALFCSMVMLISAGTAQAHVLKRSMAELAADADSVVIGTVVERKSQWNADHTRIYTSVVIAVEENLKSNKGTPGQGRVTIIVPGGEVGGITASVSDTASFSQGEKVTVFLKQIAEAQLSGMRLPAGSISAEQFEVAGSFQGKATIQNERIDNLPVARFKEQVNRAIRGGASASDEISQPGWGLGRQVIASADSSIVSAADPFTYGGRKWAGASPVVNYYINENAASCTGEGAAVQAAAATWTAVPGKSFAFSYIGATTATAASPPLTPNGVNEIMWIDLGSGGTLARAWNWWDAGNNILEADMEFNANPSYPWSTTASTPAGWFDVQSIALHEFGHYLNLKDLYDSVVDSAKVMYGYTSAGTQKRSLHADDIAGIQWIYPALPPAAPVLSLPANGSNQALTSINFQWNASIGANRYYLLVKKVSDGTTLYSADVGNVTTFTVPGFPNDGTQYKWTVNAGVVGVSWGAPSLIWTFTNGVGVPPAGPPAAPTLIAPANVSNQALTSINFQWNASVGANKYWLQIRKASDSSNFYSADVLNVTTIAIPGFPNDGTVYNWQVWANTIGVGWSTGSTTWTFTNGAAPAAPAAPTLLSPGTAITFKWNTSTGATKYQLQVNTNATFTGTDIFNADVGNVTTREVTGATLGTTYYWQVRAGNATGWSAWSAVRSVLANTVP